MALVAPLNDPPCAPYFAPPSRRFPFAADDAGVCTLYFCFCSTCTMIHVLYLLCANHTVYYTIITYVAEHDLAAGKWGQH